MKKTSEKTEAIQLRAGAMSYRPVDQEAWRSASRCRIPHILLAGYPSHQSQSNKFPEKDYGEKKTKKNKNVMKMFASLENFV